jgi:hypothetical protein
MARTIFSIIDDLSQGLSDLRSALSPLLTLSGGSAPAAASRGGRRRGRPAGRRSGTQAAAPASAKKSAPAKRTRRRGNASPKLKALRALQGRYMGAVRHLSPSQKAQVKKARAESGYDAALKLAASFGKAQPQA